MRIHVFVGTMLTLAALIAPLSSVAQKFQEPTREELQMTSDPKAPGAPAVFLFREEITDNFSHYVSRYVRIKVLAELGKEWATVEVPYRPGYQGRPVVEGRTIHPDGSVYPLAVSEADLVAGQSKAIRLHKLVFNLPNVTVGSILEYRWTRAMTGTDLHFYQGLGEADRKEALAGLGSSELANEIPEWEVQQRLFVHKEHFYYNPLGDLERNVIGSGVTHYVDGEIASYLLFTGRLPPGVQLVASPKKDFVLDVQDIPAVREEPNAPPIASTLYRVRFYYTPYTTSAAYWESEGKRWSKELDQFASPTEALKSAAAQITADAATPEAKARKLYDAVQALENTSFTRAKSEAERQQLHMKRELKKAEDAWREKSGMSNQLAALYLALARAAGLEVYGIQVADRDSEIFDPNYLSLEQLDSLLVIVRIDGKDIFLDPGQKLCPFGQLHWTHLLAGGLSEATKGPAYTPPNATKDAITAHTADLTLDASGGVSGTVKILMNGPAALRWRQLNLTADQTEVQNQFNATLPGLLPAGVGGEVMGFKGLDTAEGYLQVTVKVGGRLGNLTGKRMMVPGFFFSTGAHAQFVAEEKRESAVDLHYADQSIDDVVYHLPAGFTVESAPQPAQLPWPEHAALVVKTQPGTGTIEIKRIYARAFILLDPKEYPALRDYAQKIAASDQQQVVLAAAAGGN